MSDQTIEQDKGKSPGLLRQILRWLWVILLSCLLLICLIFAAPWKVITLIAIFLVAATILLRGYRRWFWAGVGVVVLALIVWILLPEDNEGWRPYTFDKELAELQAKYAVPDSENAAIIYNQILENWKRKEPNEPNLPDNWHALTLNGPWLSKDHPEIAAYLWYHRDTIDKLLQATKFQKCSFPIVSNVYDFSKDLPRLSATRQWAYLLIAAGNNDLAEGNSGEAIEKYLALLRMGQHLSRQPSSLDMMVGVGIEALGLGCINNFVVSGNANEFYLNKLEQAVSEIKHDWCFELPGFIDLDKLMFKNMCGRMLYQVNTKGRPRLTRDPTAIIRDMIKEDLPSEIAEDVNIQAVVQKWTNPGYWGKKFFKTFTILYWFYAPATPDKLSEIVNMSYEKNYQMTRSDFDWSKEPREVPIESFYQFKLNFRQLAEMLAKTNAKTYFGLHDTYLKSQAKQRGTLLTIALRRYKNANGHWPEKLEDIENSAPAEIFIDPINCGSFVYKRIDDNFILYSRGKNNIDEGGEHETKFSDDYRKWEIIKDDVMIWPIRSKSSAQKEAKVDANE